MYHNFKIRTNKRVELVSITSQIADIIAESEIDSGIAVVYVPHTTCGITINENADPSVAADIIMELNKLIPFDDNYAHTEGNSAAHIKSSVIGSSVNLIIENGSILLGTWQGIFLCEFDGPRTRSVLVKVLGG